MRALRRSFRAWLRAAGAGEDEIHDLILATSEAAANAIEHAYGPAEAVYDVLVHCDEGEVEIMVRDYGRWRPSRRTDRGRGLPLMEGMTDHLAIERRHDGTEVSLRRRLADTQTCVSGGDRTAAVVSCDADQGDE